MRKTIEKSILIIFSLYTNHKFFTDIDLAFYFLTSIVFSVTLDLLSNKKAKFILYISFIVLIFYDNLFLFYFPVILYNMYIDFNLYSIFFLSFLAIDFQSIILLLSLLSLYLSESNSNVEFMIIRDKNVKDSLRQETISLKRYNKQLEIDEEKNIHIAILTERNRIAREIHDSIGHSLSSSILQVKALKIISNHTLEEPLDLLQNTLNSGMNEIRNSLQGLRNESLDLKSKIETLIDKISTLDVDFSYNMEDDLEYELKFDMLSVVKEAITNVIKHSDATKLNINLFSHPNFYLISIRDNGGHMPSFKNKGIGLDFINETASKYDGLFNYKFEDGFKIHLTLMKRG